MDFEERLLQIIEHAGSPSVALAAVAHAIAQDELSDACGVFLAGPEGELALWAQSRRSLTAMRRAAEAVAREALARVAPAQSTRDARAIAAAPLLSHARPIGALVVERGAEHPYAPGEIRRLAAIASRIVGVIESARIIDMIEHATDTPGPEARLPEQEPRDERILQGIAASPGIAIGRCVFRQTFPRNLLRRDVARQGSAIERARLRDAVEKTRNDLKRLQSAIASELGEEHALVFGSHLTFLSDPMLFERIEEGIAAGLSAAAAVDRARMQIVARLGAVGDAYIRERVEDFEDLCSRMLSHLLGGPGAATSRAEIVVSRQVVPSLVVELHGRGALGIATELGGSTSHAVLLARALGFPAVTGVAELLNGAIAGEMLVIDGDRGVVVVSPTAQTIEAYRARLDAKERARTEFAIYRDRLPVTADGVRITLRANVAFGVDVEVARENNAEGIGLYRTEFPFIVRDGVPTIEEQVRIYKRSCRAFPDHPVIFRILDLGADKLLLGTGLDPAANAFQGYRSIRLLFDHPYVLREQIQAFALAAGAHPLSILIPMVTSIEELRRVKTLIAAALAEHPDTAGRAAPPSIGVLIEVPAAVEIAAELARESDFLSIGTNDLIQYALVIDRDDPRLSSPIDAFHPAVLRMVRKVIAAAHAAGKEVSVCGEIAARFELSLALLALGVDTLSVTPRIIPELKQRLARHALGPLARDMDAILALSTAAELETAIRAHLGG